jgi:small subunit ribosomal protein S4
MNSNDIERLTQPDSVASLEFLVRVAIKSHYGLHERQLNRMLKLATKSSGPVGESLVLLCERRLDNVLMLAGLTRSRAEAKQAIHHGHIVVNEQSIAVPAYLVAAGDRVTVPRRRTIQSRFQKLPPDCMIPANWLTLEPENFTIAVARVPTLDEATLPVDLQKLKSLFLA